MPSSLRMWCDALSKRRQSSSLSMSATHSESLNVGADTITGGSDSTSRKGYPAVGGSTFRYDVKLRSHTEYNPCKTRKPYRIFPNTKMAVLLVLSFTQFISLISLHCSLNITMSTFSSDVRLYNRSCATWQWFKFI